MCRAVRHVELRGERSAARSRAATGARCVRAQILRQFLAQGMRVSLLGCVAGLGLAGAFTRVLAGMLFGVSPWDPITMTGVIVLVITVSIVASLLPAREPQGSSRWGCSERIGSRRVGISETWLMRSSQLLRAGGWPLSPSSHLRRQSLRRRTASPSRTIA